eukprot:GHVU01035816.1.p1 GENE.GHVU01035816.1~~GHVU01035816.1.p1  ORF type:complete len:222 (-),score=35.78 GHVU01035816.1:1361-2026(-)
MHCNLVPENVMMREFEPPIKAEVKYHSGSAQHRDHHHDDDREGYINGYDDNDVLANGKRGDIGDRGVGGRGGTKRGLHGSGGPGGGRRSESLYDNLMRIQKQKEESQREAAAAAAAAAAGGGGDRGVDEKGEGSPSASPHHHDMVDITACNRDNEDHTFVGLYIGKRLTPSFSDFSSLHASSGGKCRVSRKCCQSRSYKQNLPASCGKGPRRASRKYPSKS